MALITDGQINTANDLRCYESSLFDTASAEGIDLSTKLVLADRELEVEVNRWLERECVDTNIEIRNVVVTEPLRQWHALHTLSLVFRDAYHQQLNDRFRGKWNEYTRLSAGASAALFERGLGVVRSPIPRAQRPDATITVGGLAAATYYVRVAWNNDAGDVVLQAKQSRLIALTDQRSRFERSDGPIELPDGMFTSDSLRLARLNKTLVLTNSIPLGCCRQRG